MQTEGVDQHVPLGLHQRDRVPKRDGPTNCDRNIESLNGPGYWVFKHMQPPMSSPFYDLSVKPRWFPLSFAVSSNDVDHRLQE